VNASVAAGSGFGLFFKLLKQQLKIKTFVGTSANAVRVQIWTALIAVLIVRYLLFRSAF
jgi:IS4 transposase